MILSILICSLHSRALLLKELLSHLNKQIKDKKTVEVLVNLDNKERSTGKKRNELVQLAKGKYVVFIDDDDWVADNYIKLMIDACESGCDCVAINGIITTDGENEIKWRLSKDNDNVTIQEHGKPVYLRKTNHITAIKREHALKVKFPDKSNGEDKFFSDEVNKFLKTETVIYNPIYHYRFTTKNKEYK